jgi:Cof subfamily protein (haloacid dehalogenase superfamily)
MKKKRAVCALKIFAIDLDGTLLADGGILSERSKTAILRALDRGIQVVIATGRILPTALAAVDAIPQPLPLICLNGALVYDTPEDKVIFSQTIAPRLAREVMDLAKPFAIHPQLFGLRTLYSDQWTPLLRYLQNKYPGETLSFVVGEIPYDTPFYKISLNGDPAELQKLVPRLARLPLAISASEAGTLELTHPDATKGKALERFLDYYQAAARDVVVFGNQSNDLSMFEVAGMSVAVANASAEVKSRASMITASNNDDGVAQAMETLMREL